MDSNIDGIKDYFIDSKQLERYENNTLNNHDVVILSSNNVVNKDIDKKIISLGSSSLIKWSIHNNRKLYIK